MNYDDLLLTKQHLEAALINVSKLLSVYETNAQQVNATNLPNMPNVSKVNYIIRAISEYSKLPEVTILEGKSKGYVAEWKRIACYILTDYAHLGLAIVRDTLNYKDHNSVCTHRDKMRFWMANPSTCPKDTYVATLNILKKIGYEVK